MFKVTFLSPQGELVAKKMESLLAIEEAIRKNLLSLPLTVYEISGSKENLLCTVKGGSK